MALASGTVFAISASATTGNVNGSGFNPASTGFNTDLVGASANTASPVVTSASYTFVAGDVGNWVYVKSGTNWTTGWYQIASVATGAATLSAAIGAAVTNISSTGIVTYNSVAGCATVASPTAGTYGVDYSQTNTAMATSSSATSSGAGSVILFSGSTQSMIGNFVHIISGTNFTPGWYEIISESVGVSITTDRASTTGVGAAGVINIGGAGNFNGLEDLYQAMLPIAAQVFVQNGSYTLSSTAIATASTNGTSVSSVYWNGYNAVRGDVCVGTNRPIFNATTNSVAVQWSQYHFFNNFIFTTNTAAGFVTRTGTQHFNCKFLNSSTTSNRIALSNLGNFANLVNCEIVSQNGIAVSPSTGAIANVIGCYIHDSATGINASAAVNYYILNNLFEACTTDINFAGANPGNNVVQGNTFYGREAKSGTGLSLTANSPNNVVTNNIFYGLNLGITVLTGTSTSNISQNNDFSNNNTDVTNWIKSSSDLALNPTFTGASQLTGSTATATGGTSTLTDSGASFGVTDNVDYLHITSVTGGTGTIVGCYLITGHTATTLTTNNAIGTSGSITAINYFVTHGHNFQIGTPLKGLGFPTLVNATGSQTTSYPDVGAVQRQESSSGASGGSFTFVG